MKKYIKSAFAPYDREVTRFMSMLAGRFNATANHELPEVELELNSYNVGSDTIQLFGDVVYEGVNKPITLTIKYRLETYEDLNLMTYMEIFPRFVSAYYTELEKLYGVDFNEEFPPVDVR